MTVPSLHFLLFAIVAAVVVNLSAAGRWRQGVMLLANGAFLASFSRSLPAFLPLIGFVLGGYVLYLAQRFRRPLVFWTSLSLLIITFFWLKKYMMIPSQFFIVAPYVTVGMSYIFFRMAHLVIDAGQDAAQENLGLIEYLNYTLHFPCIVAGPIQMFPDYVDGNLGRPKLTMVGGAFERILIGAFKVAVISAPIGALQDDTKAAILRGVHNPWLDAGIFGLYPIFLFMNFSGYTDVVIGASCLLGQEIPENFDKPFLSKNFIEFWGRWHISLSVWLRTYVFNPLLMSGMARFRAPAAATTISIMAFFVTFFLVGLWHGQTMAFVFFGVLQGGGVAINKAYQIFLTWRLGPQAYRELCADPLYGAICRGLTFTWFGFTLLWFWNDWPTLQTVFGHLGPEGSLIGLAEVMAMATVALTGLAVVDGRSARAERTIRLFASPYVRTVFATIIVYVLFVVGYVLSAPPPQVVYKAF